MNTVQIHSAVGLAKDDRLAFRVEKPPVPKVDMAWQTASNQSIPDQWSRAACDAVNTK